MDAALEGVRVLAIDSAPLIYLVEDHAVFGPPMAEIAARLDAGTLEVVASTLTLTEGVDPALATRQDGHRGGV